MDYVKTNVTCSLCAKTYSVQAPVGVYRPDVTQICCPKCAAKALKEEKLVPVDLEALKDSVEDA